MKEGRIKKFIGYLGDAAVQAVLSLLFSGGTVVSKWDFLNIVASVGVFWGLMAYFIMAFGAFAVIDEIISAVVNKKKEDSRGEGDSGKIDLRGGRGGDAGNAKGSGVSIGGPGGPGGHLGPGGKGGDAGESGPKQFSMGGEGGEGARTDRPARGGRSPLEILGYPNVELPDGRMLYEVGKGGDGGFFPATKPIIGKTFTKETIRLDGVEYQDCTFIKCTFRWDGGYFSISNSKVNGWRGISTKDQKIIDIIGLLKFLGFLSKDFSKDWKTYTDE